YHRLTAIAQPSKDIGARAVEVLLDRLAEPDGPVRTVRLPCTFVQRTSCGRPDGPEERVPVEPALSSAAHPPGETPSAPHERPSGPQEHRATRAPSASRVSRESRAPRKGTSS